MYLLHHVSLKAAKPLSVLSPIAHRLSIPVEQRLEALRMGNISLARFLREALRKL
jgi:hypothetical protein